MSYYDTSVLPGYLSILASYPQGSGTPRPKTISARTFRPIFQSGTARPTLVGPLGPFYYYYFGGGGGNLLFYSVYVHQNKIQEPLFNMS